MPVVLFVYEGLFNEENLNVVKNKKIKRRGIDELVSANTAGVDAISVHV